MMQLGLTPAMDFGIACGITIILTGYSLITNRRLLVYLALPLTLLWIHVGGSFLQEGDSGPEWAQNHMHNLGVPAMTMLWGVLWQRSLAARYRSAGSSLRGANTKATMMGIVRGFTIGVVIGLAIEILMITTARDSATQQGYSGALDWLDVAAYLVGETLIILNYRKAGRHVLRKTAQDERQRRRR